MAVNRDPLLVAGPSGLDERGWWQGSAFVAAAAAAILTPVQLWSRVAGEPDARQLAVLADRGIDPAGCNTEGEGALSALEPVSVDGLAGCLLVDLDTQAWQRAHQCLAALPGAAERPLIAVWTGAVEPDLLAAAAGAGAVVVCGLAAADQAWSATDGVEVAERLLAAGAAAVALTAGALGGILAYKQKRTTWPALPAPSDHPSGWARAAFAGTLAAEIALRGRIDWRNGKRAAATAGAFAYEAARQPRPKRLMRSGPEAVHQAYLKVRRNGKS